MSSLICRYPLTAFLVWFFTVGQALAFTPMIAHWAVDVELSSEAFVVAATLVGLLLPAVLITWVTEGPEGLSALRRRSLNLAVPARWYALALVGIPLLTVVGTVGFLGMPESTTASELVSFLLSGLGLQLLIVFVTVNWWEEVAWMGFLQKRLQDRRGAMGAAALTGVAFALGHVSLAVGGSWSETATLLGLLLAVGIPFRALAGWICNRTDSIALVGLVHAAANATAVGSLAGMGFLPRLYPGGEPGGLVFPLLALLGVVVIVMTRGRLGRSPVGEHPTRATPRATVAAPVPQETP
ncbi:CPBP family intramembrane glutamic endopeptidase [Ornithinimicrobium cryptoxanthini]|uniref:CPBP family intramembrane glutamic endopeptidase n=1 Tax=Ornithinimicrobium cryptoxanthini TaxID=2934161 RepID=UPI0021189681|nr:type II CAAX endopeptidase family protein [Ornithinimicrobium cryptoxanthini]